MMYTVSNQGNYNQACQLVKDLGRRKVEANITVGGVHIHPDTDEQVKVMYEVCATHDLIPYIGETVLMQWMNMNPDERDERLKQLEEDIQEE